MSNPNLIIIGTAKMLKGQWPILAAIPHRFGSAPCLAAEIRQPVVWYYESATKTLQELNPKTHLLTGRSIAIDVIPVATLVDPFTANVWLLSDAIYTLSPTATQPSVVPLLQNESSVAIAGASDLKLDFAQRKLWIVDSQNARVIQANLDGTVVATYSVNGAPTALAVNPVSGLAYVRCTKSDATEAVFQVGGSASWNSPEVVLSRPLSSSIIVDAAHQRLLWVTNTLLHIVDLASGISQSIPLGFTGLRTLDADLNSNWIYVGGNSDVGAFNLADFSVSRVSISGLGAIQALFIEQGHGSLLPGYFEVVAAASVAVELPGSFEISTKLFNVQALENGAAIYDPQPDRDVYLPSPPDQKTANVEILVWSDSMDQLQTSGLAGLPNERWRTPEAIIRLPKFTWSSTSYLRNPGLLIGRNSDLERWNLPLDSTGYISDATQTAIFQGAKQPAGATPITGITATEGQQIAYVSAGQWLMLFDVDSLALLDAQKLDYYAQPTDIGWLTATKDGKIIHRFTPQCDAATATTTHGAGFALQFDGTQNYMDVPYAAALYPATFTIECRLKIAATPAALFPSFMATRNSTTGGGGFNFTISSTGVLAFYATGITTAWFYGASTLALDSWNHVAVTFDGSTLTLWVNGVADATLSVSGAITDTGNLLAFGTDVGHTVWFAGIVDEARISDLARYTDTFIPPTSLGTDGNVVGYWPCNEGTGITVGDASGNGHDGTLEGAPVPTWVDGVSAPPLPPPSPIPTTTVVFDALDTPRKALWSDYHQKTIVMGGHTVSILDVVSGKSTVIAASKTHWFGDIDIAPNGELLIISYPVKTGMSSARLLNPTFTRAVTEVFADDKYFLKGRITKPGCFLAAGVPAVDYVAPTPTPIPPIIIVESSGSSSSSSDSESSSSTNGNRLLWFVTASVGQQTATSLPIHGSLIDLSYESGTLFAVATTSGGDLVEVPALGQERAPRIVKNIGLGIVAASDGPHGVTASSVPQSQVRIFVGSRPWQSDRWDSGPITTSKNAILYGGGDNLESGMPYWVHIATYHADSGWAAPTIRRFLVPK